MKHHFCSNFFYDQQLSLGSWGCLTFCVLYFYLYHPPATAITHRGRGLGQRAARMPSHYLHPSHPVRLIGFGRRKWWLLASEPSRIEWRNLAHKPSMIDYVKNGSLCSDGMLSDGTQGQGERKGIFLQRNFPFNPLSGRPQRDSIFTRLNNRFFIVY